MENTMNTSEKIGELAGALAKAQLKFKAVLKDTKNPYFNSKYADLATVIGATQAALAENGLVVIQSPVVDAETEKAGVVTVLAHASGEWLSHELALPATMKGKDGNARFDAQSVGSAITYARRYSYQAIVGVAAEVDDDGNAAADNQIHKEVEKQKRGEPKTGEETVTLTAYKEGFLALSGNGLPVVRASIDNAKMGELEWKWEGSIAMIPAKNGFAFVDLCKKHNVGTVWMDAPKPNGPVKAVIPPFEPVSDKPSTSDDPIIDSTDRKKFGSRECLNVMWNGQKYGCWDKSLFPHLEHYKGRPASLILTPTISKKDGKEYMNITGIERLDGEAWAERDEQDQTLPY